MRGRRLAAALLLTLAGALGVGHLVPAAQAGFVATITDTRNTASSGVLPCRTAAAAANPYFIYPFADADGATAAADTSGNSRPGTYSAAGVTYGVAGPCTTDGGRAVALDGSTGAVAGAPTGLSLLTFSEAVWFKTNSSGGGLLIGVGDAATGDSTQHDRALYLSGNGALNFEIKPAVGAPVVISSSAGLSNGAWHLAVATFSTLGGMTLYVDGVQVATGSAAAVALTASAFWRIGDDSLAGVGATQPPSAHFAGSMAYASVYTSVLSAAQVTALWNARS